MNPEEIKEAAKEAGNMRPDPLSLGGLDVDLLQRFAAIIEKRTIERCVYVLANNAGKSTSELAAAIRKLGEQ